MGKNNARSIAAKLAWAKKTPQERAMQIAKMQAGRARSKARDNLSRKKQVVGSNLGLIQVGSAEQLGLVTPPYATPKQAERWARAEAFQLVPVTSTVHDLTKTRTKTLPADKQAARNKKADQMAANLDKNLRSERNKLSRLGLPAEAMEDYLARWKNDRLQKIANYREGVTVVSRGYGGMYAQNVNKYPGDATLQGYADRISALEAERRSKRVSKPRSADTTTLMQAARKDKSGYNALKRKLGITDMSKATGAQRTELLAGAQSILAKSAQAEARPNPSGKIMGALKVAGAGVGTFLGLSIISNFTNRMHGALGTIARFGAPAIAGWLAYKHIDDKMTRNVVIGAAIASALAGPMVSSLLSRLPLVGGLFERVSHIGAGGGAAAAIEGTDDLYDEAFGMSDYEDDAYGDMGAYVQEDVGAYVQEDVGAYVQEDVGEMSHIDHQHAVNGYVTESVGAYVQEDLDAAASAYDDAVSGDFREAVAGDYREAVAGPQWREAVAGAEFREAVAGDDDMDMLMDGELLELLQEAEEAPSLSGPQLNRWNLFRRAKLMKRRNPRLKFLATTRHAANKLCHCGAAVKVADRGGDTNVVALDAKKAAQIVAGVLPSKPVTRTIHPTRPVTRKMGQTPKFGGVFRASVFGHVPGTPNY